jgi:hypothetical protein
MYFNTKNYLKNTSNHTFKHIFTLTEDKKSITISTWDFEKKDVNTKCKLAQR